MGHLLMLTKLTRGKSQIKHIVERQHMGSVEL